MKKILILTLAPVVLILGGIIFAVSLSYSYVQYENDAYFHIMSAMDDDKAFAEYFGETTIISGGNLRKINSLLTPSELKRIFIAPKYDEDECIVLSLPDGAQYVVAQDEDTEDGVFIKHTYGNKKQYFKVHGYKTFEWLQKAISLEGIYGENRQAGDD